MFLKKSSASSNFKYIKELLLSYISFTYRSIFILILFLGFQFYVFRLGALHYSKLYNYIYEFKEADISFISNYIRGKTSKIKIINIDIKHEDFQKLSYLRKKAIELDNRIITRADSYVNAKVSYLDKKVNAKVRLKGDVINHIEGDKWSLRVKIKGDDAILGMRRFSLQHPRRSSWVNEWILHQFYKYEGLISLRYDFINLIINGKNYGVYALEESFDKELIENNKRREGPILKFNESPLMDNPSTYLDQKDIFSTTNIEAFRYSKIKKNSTLLNNFILGENILRNFRDGNLEVSDAFDLDKLAKLYALTNITNSYHSLRWKNVRFYYNPVISKLELIGYNAYNDAIKIISQPTMSKKNYIQGWMVNEYHDLFFNDIKFMRSYNKHLDRMSEKKYLDGFFEYIQNDLKNKISIINNEYPFYQYKKSDRYKSQKIVKDFLNPINPIMLKTLVESNDKSKKHYSLKIANKSFSPLDITNLQLIGKDYLKYINKTLPAHVNGEKLQFHDIRFEQPDSLFIKNILENGLKINFNISGLPEKSKVVEIPTYEIIRENIIPSFKGKMKNFSNNTKMYSLSMNSDSLFFNAGEWIINESLIIPKDLVVIIPKGTNIDLTENSMIFCNSPIIMNGTKELPIKIFSSDKTGRGVIISHNTKHSSILNYVYFSNLNNPSLNKWLLTGSVNFYESPVQIYNCSFMGNFCEDALNIIRSDFIIENCYFKDTYGDAFDGDFTKGTIKKTTFIDIGNDAIDISGSNIFAENILIKNSGDKGFSAGENSILHIKNSFISSSNIGVASKDFSSVKIDNSEIINTKYLLAAYQKKPEYGPSSISINNSKLIKKDENNFLIERGSKIDLNGETILSNSKNVKTLLYD